MFKIIILYIELKRRDFLVLTKKVQDALFRCHRLDMELGGLSQD